MRRILVLSSIFALAACGFNGTDADQEDQSTQAQAPAEQGEDYGYDTYSDDNLADSMASSDDASAADRRDTIADPEDRPVMQAQVVLDRQGFGPGVIDGKMGMSTKNALMGFQEANELKTSGELDDATRQALAQWDRIPATRVVTIPESWGRVDYTDMPESAEAQAELDSLGYTSLDEKVAERFHTTIEVLQALNPGGKPAGMAGAASAAASPSPSPSSTGTDTSGASSSIFRAGQQIRVPNIGADRIEPGALQDRDWQRTLASLGVGTEQPQVDRIVVSKAGKTLKAYSGEKLVALFSVSSGSSQFPLPIGNWDIVGEAYNPDYQYDPEVLGKGSGEVYTLPPGPNSPVGVVWIDLSKEHYGIHGTPDPETIGRAQSSGCVRLTNWDAARLSQMVDSETEVVFEA
ncbi:L,D-transpeptidase family protein [Qipengyuania sp. JC766]|uniref:L,D-transpeptidase family protein n=1 Tax=Qipengyuania sp. JC766 TaxID=3232139 RepID=UPI0034576EE4